MRALPASVLAACGLIVCACGGAASSGSTAGQAAEQATARATAASTGQAAEPRADGTGEASRPAPAADEPAAKPLGGKVVVIDPGHNGGNFRDPRPSTARSTC